MNFFSRNKKQNNSCKKRLGTNTFSFLNSHPITNKRRLINYHTIDQLKRFLSKDELVIFFDEALEELEKLVGELAECKEDRGLLAAKLHTIKGIAANMGMKLLFETTCRTEDSLNLKQGIKVNTDQQLIRDAYELTKHNKHLILQNE